MRLLRHWLLLTQALGLLTALGTLAGGDPLAECNVVWTTPSTNSSGSMPLGNGDLGVNPWVEEGGDLLFYVSKTDAWDAHSRLLKLGRIRVKLAPNPFHAGLPFRQELRLREGDILITAGQPDQALEIRVWVDALQPVVRLELEGRRPFWLEADLEVWRTRQRDLTSAEMHGVEGFRPDQSARADHDTIVSVPGDRLIWYHRNTASAWPVTLKHQGLESLTARLDDPLLGRTFGAALLGTGLVKRDPATLVTAAPAKRFSLALHALTAQTESSGAWLRALEQQVERTSATSWSKARRAHLRWWDAFWDRSWIRVSGLASGTASGAGSAGAVSTADTVSEPAPRVVNRGYAWQRFINACGGRGSYPIKFNGSIFTVDVPGRFDPDYRQWGAYYWFQNTRLPYWPMLASGDFDLMGPFFRMYHAALPLARERSRLYFDHPGACFPETIYFWGTYANGDFGFGWDRAKEPHGRAANPYIRYYWSGALELTAMMLDYHAFTGDQEFLHGTLAPFAREIVTFYDRHYPREPDGRLRIEPAQALETWWVCVNPMPEIAGLRWVLDGLLTLPESAAPETERSAWRRLRAQLPPIPTRTVNGQTTLAPAESFVEQRNSENPELYAVFPYRLFGVTKPELELARRTFAARQFQGNRGWQQDETQAALLGLAEEAGRLLAGRFAAKHAGSRFPAFWGPNFDWIPDQDHGGNGLMALQTMLLQWGGRKILLFPAWPKEWDVEFRLHAPFRTVIEGAYRGGKIERLKVSPRARMKDVILLHQP